jgi:hypothetical protein
LRGVNTTTLCEKVQQNANKSRQKSTDGRPKMAAYGQPVEQPLAPVEGSGIQHGQQDHEQGQEQVRPQLPRVGKRQIGNGKQRLPTRICAKDAIGNDAGHSRRNDDLGFKFGGAVEDFGREHGPRQGCAENGGDPCPHAGGHEDAAFGRTQSQHVGQKTTKAGPDLRDRTFASS